ncbi:metastasis-associated protein MTA3 [Anabrus simplex]|uniref:metastasis-associated protein MTA3 n=1 Tax=Anabrus simplex TaxID=316456 RepID=UPI0035A2CF4F
MVPCNSSKDSTTMTANMYRVGDYVYFEASSTSPYQIRRIEELNKTSNGNVEAKVMCFFRRRDLPSTLIMLADRHQSASSDESTASTKLNKLWMKNPVSEETDLNIGPLKDDCDFWGRDQQLNGKQRHQLKHRELFLSRQVETLPATHIRGKCSVTLLGETESLLSYLNKEDTFFYCLVFDPVHKTLLQDRGEIRVGSRYQADPTPLLREGEQDDRRLEDLETLVWTPEHHLTDRQIDQFLVIARSVGTFARALDCSSSVKQPSLHMSAAAASRDVTLFHAMDTLHKHNYNVAEAISALVPAKHPVLCRDEMEEWSASEANLFEEALEKYGKDFNDIRQDFLPWKSLYNIIEYYYMWKTTDRYVQQKRVKAVEAESKLKQVYIPQYNKPNAGVINNNSRTGIVNGNDMNIGGKVCESCGATVSSEWYAWGPSHMQCKLCHSCWLYWKKYGGLKVPSRMEKVPSNLTSYKPHQCGIVNCGKVFKQDSHLARHYAAAHGLAITSVSARPAMKKRSSFYLYTTPLTRIARRFCRHLIQTRHAARSPFWPINIASVKQECQHHIAGKSAQELKELLKYRSKDRGSVTQLANRLGQPNLVTPEWLILTDKDMLPKPDRASFPKPPKGPDGSLLYEHVPNKPENSVSPALLKRRAYEEVNGMGSAVVGPPPAKRHNKDPSPQQRGPSEGYSPVMGCSVIKHLNGKAKIVTVTCSESGRKQVISWMDASEDVYFQSTEGTKRMRRQFTPTELRRAARKPWRKLNYRGMDEAAPMSLDRPSDLSSTCQ